MNKHIDHYWIAHHASKIFQTTPPIYAYPGITPEMILVLDGHYTLHYLGKTHYIDHSILYSFIHKEVILDFSKLTSFIIIQFKSRALSSIKPFVNKDAGLLMQNSVRDMDEIFGESANKLVQHFRKLSPLQIVDELNQWLMTYYQQEQEGFLTEMADDLRYQSSVQEMMSLTKYSYSTLERYFKKDTGLTPKQYQSLQRYKLAVEEIYKTRNPDWLHYVEKYGYFDQSHFIKDIKRFTTFTPAQLLGTPGLLSFRPKNS